MLDSALAHRVRAEALERPRLLIAAVGAVVVLLVAAVVLIAGAGDDGAGGGDRAGESALPELAERHRDREAGIRVGWPAGWKQRSQGGVLRLRSPGRDVEVLISAPAPEGQAGAALQAEIDAISRRYEVLSKTKPTRRRIGGLRGREVVVSALQEAGNPVRILVASANGKRKTYVVEVIAAHNAQAGLAGAQAIVNSLKLTS